MNTKVLLVAFAIVAVSMGDNLTMMGDNMTGTSMGNTTAGG
jgi:hypothetical protein